MLVVFCGKGGGGGGVISSFLRQGRGSLNPRTVWKCMLAVFSVEVYVSSFLRQGEGSLNPRTVWKCMLVVFCGREVNSCERCPPHAKNV